MLDLPDDCLRIIFDKVAFGGNKLAIRALSASCRTLRHAMAHYPAHIALEGKWDADEIAGGPQHTIV